MAVTWNNVPQTDSAVEDFNQAVDNAQPNLALYHLTRVVDELRDEIEELKSSAKKPAKKTAATKKKSDTES